MTVFSNANIENNDIINLNNFSKINCPDPSFKIFTYSFADNKNNQDINKAIKITKNFLALKPKYKFEDRPKGAQFSDYIPFDPITDNQFVYVIGSNNTDTIGSIRIQQVSENSTFESMHIFLTNCKLVKFLEIQTQHIPCNIYLLNSAIGNISAIHHGKNQIAPSKNSIKIINLDNVSDYPKGIDSFNIDMISVSAESTYVRKPLFDMIKISVANKFINGFMN